MKLERLCKILELHSRPKLYVLTEGFCLCGYASQPLEDIAGVWVKIDSSVRVVLSSMELIHEPTCSGTLFLTENHKVTRRIQTHRRHLRGHPIPDEYFRQAKVL